MAASLSGAGEGQGGKVGKGGDGGGGGGGVSIAFSCLSTGVYGYPSNEAARVACRVVREWLQQQQQEEGEEKKVGRVVFCCFLEKDVRAYEEWLP